MIRFGVEKSGPIQKYVVPDEDIPIFRISNPQHLSLIASPLATEDEIHHGAHSHPDNTLQDADDEHGAADAHPAGDASREGSSASEYNPADARHPDEPVLKRAHEASTIQLFFDLFFVANLTTFSTIHEVDTWSALESYMGYFAIIWFTWFQNTLFDVRFSNDSAFERMCKVMQFGIMTGFAVTGPGYITDAPTTEQQNSSLHAFQALSLILMSSRLILAFQYSVAFWWIRSYKKARWPMLAHIGVLLASATVFLGLYFGFQLHGNENVLAGWYVVVALEALTILIISGKVRFLSFRRTVLVERLGLLTLIILGEGIIDMCTSINSIGSDDSYTSDIIGMIICSVATIYSMWMLYFDQVQPERMGAFRQHLWAVVHFLFHISILLVVEGLSRLSVWRKVLDVVRPLESVKSAFQYNATGSDLGSQVDLLQNATDTLYGKFNPSTRPARPAGLTQYWDILNGTTPGNSTDPSSAMIQYSVNNITDSWFTWSCSNFKITLEDDLGPDQNTLAIFEKFRVVFVYFFLFAGLNLIFLGILFLLGKRHKLRGELLTVAVRWAAGLGLALVSLMAVNSLQEAEGDDALHNYIYSPWMLPTVLIVYLNVILIDNLLIRYVKTAVNFRLHLHKQKETAEPAAAVVEEPKVSAESSGRSAA